MGNSILRGISAALIVTVITLIAGMFWTAMGLGGLTMSSLVDIGLLASCVTAGFRAGKDSGQWILGGLAGLGYVALCIILVALFLEVSGWGAIQVFAEGGLIGGLAGALGASRGTGKNRFDGFWRSPGRSSFSSWGSGSDYDVWDNHVNDWGDLDIRKEPQDPKGYSGEKEPQEEKIQWSKQEENEWDSWVREEKKDPSSSYQKAWWEEDVL